MNFIRRIFKRKQFKPEPKELRIDGCKTTLTPTPDDAELAAQALLESRIYGDKTQVRQAKKAQAQQGTAAYYRQLSEKIRTARGQERRSAMRYVAYCEEELKKEDGRWKMEDVNTSAISHQPSDISHQTSDIAELERGLYKFQDCAEREGGELLKRWQKCLAECLLLEMKTKTNTDLTDGADEHQPSDI